MALPATRMEYKIALSNVDRGVELAETVIVAAHPSESLEHVNLRVLAWCLLYEERLAFGPGLSSTDSADLWTHDLTGRLTTWIECGTASLETVRWVLQHHAGAAVHAVFAGRRRRDELLAEIADAKRAVKGLAGVGLWTVDPALVTALCASDERRRKWGVTVVGDHFYIEADGANHEGAVERSSAV